MARSFITPDQKLALRQFFINLRHFAGGTDSSYPDDLGIMIADAINGYSDEDVEIFADPVTGNDENPGSQDLPVKTFQKAWTLGAIEGTRKRLSTLRLGRILAPLRRRDRILFSPRLLRSTRESISPSSVRRLTWAVACSPLRQLTFTPPKSPSRHMHQTA